MIHLSAFINRTKPFAEETIRSWTSSRMLPELRNQWVHHSENLFMSIQGDKDLSHWIFESPQLVLICDTDLLGSRDCGDFQQANLNPAEFLADRYMKLGDAFARDLHGWFGIILYDRERDTIKAWTDHFGIRRLVYRDASKAFGVASDLRLLHRFFAEQPEIDPVAILEYLQYSCIPAPRTIYKNTSRLEPGHFLAWKSALSVQAYWDMQYPEVLGRSLSSWAAETYGAIESAVSLAAKRSDESETLGCFLSGGTDSSSVSGIVGKLTAKPPATFSIGFEDPRYNEIEYARIAARHFKSVHHEYFVRPEDILNLLGKAYTVYDEPFGNSSIVPAYYCARLAAENGTKYLLAGDGGDELFGGNQRYASDRVFQKYFKIPGLVRSHCLEPLTAGLAKHSSFGYINLAQRYIRRASIPPPDRYSSYDFLSSVDRNELFCPSFNVLLAGTEPLAAARRHFQKARAECDMNRWLYLDLKITITDNDLRKVTPMADLAGVVPRYPLLILLFQSFRAPYRQI